MAIQIKTVKELSSASRKVFDRASAAVAQKNYAYASDMFRTLLRSEPGFVEGRKLLRQSQLDRAGNVRSNLVNTAISFLSCAVPVLFKGPALLKQGKALAALELAESAMEKNPTLLCNLRFLATAAEAAGLTEISVHTLEIATNLHPANASVLMALAKVYATREEYQKSLQTWQKLVTLEPNNVQHQTEMKSITALAAMKEANWEKADSFRDMIRDKDTAQTLEQQTRLAPRDEDTLRNLIKAAEANVAAQPSVANHKALAELYRKAKEFDPALAQYQKIIDMTGTLDPSVDEAMTEIQTARFNDAIQQWRDYATSQPDKAAEAQATIASLEQQRDDVLLHRLQERVQRYPNDAGYRYELAEMYWKHGNVDSALQEFQFSQRSPQFRRKALVYMGKCMARKGMVELAIEQLKAALDGMEKNDSDRKDALYQLAMAYEQQNDADAAMGCLRDIFSLDVNYMDVSQKLQAYYQAKKG